MLPRTKQSYLLYCYRRPMQTPIQIWTNMTNFRILGWHTKLHTVEPYSCDEIRPLNSVRRKLSGRFRLAKLAPRAACYRRGFARRIAAAAAGSVAAIKCAACCSAIVASVTASKHCSKQALLETCATTASKRCKQALLQAKRAASGKRCCEQALLQTSAAADKRFCKQKGRFK